MSEQSGVAPFPRHGAGQGARRPRGAARPQDRAQLRRLVVAGAKGVVARCRDFTREALADWGWLPAADDDAQAVVDDVLLVASELVTNACLHAGGPHELRLRGGPGLGLRIEVFDTSDALPARRDPHRTGRPGGHGMVIVERLSAAWGVVPHPGGGKTVWVDMRRP